MINAATLVMITILLSVAAFTPFAQAAEKPQAVSLDYCADQFMLSLADRDQIMSLTTQAIEGHSFFKDKARGLPLFRASSEEVLQMGPDVVIRNWGGFSMLPLLKQANIPVATAEYGTGPEMLYQNMRRIGAALQQSERAEEMINDHQERLVALKKRAPSGLRAAYIAPGGITAGKNTFVNGIIKLAGLASMSEEQGLIGWQPLPLEALVQNPPDIIIGSFFNEKNIHVSNWSLTRHGRIRQMIDTIPTIMVPGRYLSCNGIFSVDAAEYIHDELEKLLE
ncbi:MAG: ABC transporter substrate-binding protein [Emcibacter sp.]|nr:ABC transporter substrate-binding protein [Emcibacter sp.]